jgi:dTDP-4-amino-4,6-dideoxygalactose transaminase
LNEINNKVSLMNNKIPFNKPFMTGNELGYIEQAYQNGQLAGDGPFTKRCHLWLESRTGTGVALLTHSCTAALEMASILLDIQPGDEIIMPSYTFVSTANAFVLRGGVPVFVDIREDTLNIDERLIEDAITARTKAIVPVHYAGVACEMGVIMEIARRHNLMVVEDAAQGVMSSYEGMELGSIGDLGVLSFHETKNLISGEGGALLVNNNKLVKRAEIIREKGTDRSQFNRGEVSKYTWKDIGSSFLPGELISAFLLAQFEEAENITRQRLDGWNTYHNALKSLESQGIIRRPIVPSYCQHNAHMYYVLLSPKIDRSIVINSMLEHNISVVFHYVPLHSSPAGKQYARIHGELKVTDHIAERLLRLPMWIGLDTEYVVRYFMSCIKLR